MHSRIRLLAVTPLLMLATGCEGPAGIVVPVTTLLAVDFQPGKTYTYNLHITQDLTTALAGQPVPLQNDLTGIATLRVKSVDSAGVQSISETLKFTKTIVSGKATDLTGKYPTDYDLRVAKDGQILTFTLAGGGTTSAASTGGLDQMTPLLPGHAVKPGDTWTKTIDQNNPFGAGSVHVSTTNKYLRNETSHGTNAAVIDSSGKPRIDIALDVSDVLKSLGLQPDQNTLAQVKGASGHVAGDISFDRTSWMDVAHNELLRTDATVNIDVTETIVGLPGGATGASLAVPLKGRMTFSIDKA